VAGRSLTFRAFALLVAAGYRIHEARYLLVPEPRIDPAHGYLAYGPSLLALLLTVASAHSLVALGRRRHVATCVR